MAQRNRIPKEVVKKLQEHPYVERASEWEVSFTQAFKQLAYDEYYRGKSMKQVFADAGFDVDELGEKRIQNFRNQLMSKADREDGFEDRRKSNRRHEAQSTEAQMTKRIRELEHRNAYLEQENEFLKKIQELEKGYIGKAKESK